MRPPRTAKSEAILPSIFLVALVAAGIVLRASGMLVALRVLLPVLAVVFGLILLFLAANEGKAPLHRGSGISFIFAGAVLAAATLGLSLRQSWPLFMVGAALGWIVDGLSRFGRLRAATFVPSVAMLLLAGFFSLFSFGLVTMRLAKFLAIWWPAYIILAVAAIFVALWYRSRRAAARRRSVAP
ncbi:MAG: hypothetical protein ACOYM2_08245 [Rectinemataceae bacterium]